MNLNEDEMRDRGTEAQEPDECRNPDGTVSGGVQMHRQGVHHGHVTMYGHHCEKDEAAVVAQVEYEAHWFTEAFIKCPAEDEVVGPEGQTEGKNQVRDGQVQEKRIGQGFQLFKFNQHPQDQCVAHKAEYDNHRKKDWGDHCSKLHHLGLVAWIVRKDVIVVFSRNITKSRIIACGIVYIIKRGILHAKRRIKKTHISMR